MNERSTAAALARAELQTARSRLCQHGVARPRVACADCDRPAPTETEETP